MNFGKGERNCYSFWVLLVVICAADLCATNPVPTDSPEIFLHSASVEVAEFAKPAKERQVFQAGNFVVPGVGWTGGDKETVGIGQVKAAYDDGWVKVKWRDGSIDLHLASEQQLKVVNDAFTKVRGPIPEYGRPWLEACKAVSHGWETSMNEINLKIGAKVVRGPDWVWGTQDGGAGCVGKVVDIGLDKWVQVRWMSSDDAEPKAFRFGLDGAYDLAVLIPVHISKRSKDQTPVISSSPGPEILQDIELAKMASKVVKGSWVVRGRDWMWSDQDGSPGAIGEVLQVRSDQWVRVKWNSTEKKNNYRLGYKNKYDVQLAQEQPIITTTTPRPRPNLPDDEPEDLMIGDVVVRGPGWLRAWGDQDGGKGKLGVVMSGKNAQGWIRVKWDTGFQNQYRLMKGKVDLRLANLTAINTTAVTFLEDATVTNIITETETFSSIIYYSTTEAPSTLTTNLIDQQSSTTSESLPTGETTTPRSDATTSPLTPSIYVGSTVRRAKDWIWGDQDGGKGNTGHVFRIINETYWVLVKWADGTKHAYRYSLNPHGPRDLEVVSPDIEFYQNSTT